MAKFLSKARPANADGTIEVTIPRNVCEMEGIEAGDKVQLETLEVEKQETGKPVKDSDNKTEDGCSTDHEQSGEV